MNENNFPENDAAAPAAHGLLDQAAQGAHNTINRMADSAEPVVHQMGESVSAAKDVMQANAAQLRETRDEWVEGARCAVRSNPLASVAAVFALGILYARITR